MNILNGAIHTDFELQQYLQELYHEVNSLVYADDDGASKENKFTEYVMELLAEAGETESVRLCTYIKENKFENIQYKINGYAIEEGYETLDIFIAHFQDTYELYRVNKPDFDKLIKWPTAFLNAALKGHLEDIEPSSEAYGLAEIIRKKRNEFIRVNLFIISNGNIPHDPPQNFSLKGLEDLTFNFHVWDAERLHRLAQSKYNREPIAIDFKDTLGEVIPCLSMPSENDLYECYLAIVPGHLLATLYRNYGTRLLESNVRAFLQQTGKVNKGIRDTIRQEPHMFLPYNNGLATTAQEVKTSTENGQLVITGVKDFQIVNGGQTTASLFHTQKKFKDTDLNQVFVQMKLTVIKDEDKKNLTVPYISRYANSQNKVSELDLTSNNPILQRFEELSRTTYAIDPSDPNKQTIWFFERVKGQYREALNKEPTKSKQNAFKLKYPRSQVILKSQMAKYLNVWKQLPHHVSKGGQKNYNIFLKDIEAEFGKKKKPNRIYWQDIIANAILFIAVDKLFGRKNQDPIGDTNIKSYTVVYTLSYFHHLTGNRLDLGLIWDKQLIPEDLQIELKKCLKFMYAQLNSLDVALISEAAKSEKVWNEIKRMDKHPMDMDIIRKYVLSERAFNARYEDDMDTMEEASKYENLQKITSQGLRFWDGLYKYNIKTNVLSKYQDNLAMSIRKKLKQSGSLTEQEVSGGIKIIDTLHEKGVEFDKIIALSQLDDSVLVDPSNLYNRLSKLKEGDWKQVIALGEQTKTLTYNEISVIKTVVQKIKRREDLDLKRLQIVENAITKLKKYGIKY